MIPRRRIRYIGERAVPLSDTYPRGVFFVGSERPNDEGQVERRIDGTAFLVSIRSGVLVHAYVVTAAHVVEGAEKSFVRVPMKEEHGGVVDLDVPEWLPHPKHDVAVAPIRMPDGHAAVATALTQFVDDDAWYDPAAHAEHWVAEVGFDLELGDAVYFIGLLGKVEAMTERNVPIVRAGTLGRLWQERLPVQRTPVDAVKHITAHLIDCRSFAGFSGSPCYVEQFTVGRNDAGRIAIAHRHALLGLIGGHFDDWVRTRDREGYEGGVSDNLEAPVSTGVGYVIPAEFIREALMLKELTEMRDKAEAAAAARRPDAATMDSAAPNDATEFGRFEDLTRKLVNVPKAEIDEKRKGESYRCPINSAYVTRRPATARSTVANRP